MVEKKKSPFLVRADERPAESGWSHPLNPRSEMRGVSLSAVVGMQRVGFHLVRIAPGKENNAYHTQATEEEFYYILSGRGVARVDGEKLEIGPGDFLGFPAPSVPHLLTNPFDEELVYLVGGERKEVEVARFPDYDRRLIRVGRKAWLVDEAALELFWDGEG